MKEVRDMSARLKHMLSRTVSLVLNSAYGFPPKFPDDTAKAYKQLQDAKRKLTNGNH